MIAFEELSQVVEGDGGGSLPGIIPRGHFHADHFILSIQQRRSGQAWMIAERNPPDIFQRNRRIRGEQRDGWSEKICLRNGGTLDGPAREICCQWQKF